MTPIDSSSGVTNEQVSLENCHIGPPQGGLNSPQEAFVFSAAV